MRSPEGRSSPVWRKRGKERTRQLSRAVRGALSTNPRTDARRGISRAESGSQVWGWASPAGRLAQVQKCRPQLSVQGDDPTASPALAGLVGQVNGGPDLAVRGRRHVPCQGGEGVDVALCQGTRFEFPLGQPWDNEVESGSMKVIGR